MSDVTRILSQIDSGDSQAAAELLPLVYDELRRLAAAKLAQEKPGHTLQATALVHEAYLRLVGGGGKKSEVRDQKSDETAPTSDRRPLASDLWHSRGHFFAAAAEAIRRILVEHARARHSLKRGGHRQRIDLEKIDLAETPSGEQLLVFNDALAALENEDAEAARLVKLRYFAGLSVEEAGEAMGLARSTAYDHWTFARAWLRCQLDDAS
jgi:RNA polymerase sigma factor (sigma-70 family)